MLKSHTDLSLVFENGSTSPLAPRIVSMNRGRLPARPVTAGEAARVACGKILHTVGILSCPSAEHVVATGDARYGGLFHASTVALDELDGQVAARPIHINAVFAARQFDDTIADGDNRHVGLLLVLIISLGQSNAHLQSEQVHVQHIAFRKHLEIEYLAEDGREPLA